MSGKIDGQNDLFINIGLCVAYKAGFGLDDWFY
jgi:hypothetical protein